MRNLYWKIFLSFWLATILIIFTTAWVTSQIVQNSSIPAREQIFMDSYANAAVATFESGQKAGLDKWLRQVGISRHMALYLLSSSGEIIGTQTPPIEVKKVSEHLLQDKLNEGIFKSGNLIVSHEILSTSGNYYRLAAISDKPISHFIQLPWAGLTLRLTIATFFSGLICYLLSLYLTQPLRSLRQAAQSIARGKLSTRVGSFRGHHNNEISELSDEFDRMAEQLENLVLSKDRLMQDISHELRSPLARLHIAIELAKNKTGVLAETEFQRMEMECHRLNELIGEILIFARLDKSITDLDRQPLQLDQLILKIIDDANYEAGTTPARVVADTLDPLNIKLDERLIHRAIENILRNALNYSPPEQQIHVRLDSREQPGFFIIDILDSGPGVPEDQLQKIFNPFYRVDTSRTKKTGGYGLGLAIAASAVSLHGGTIEASNRAEGGLLVRIKIAIA